MAAFRADQRPDKIDLGVGVYRDAEGRTPVLAAVRQAERLRLEREDTKSYESPAGNQAFTAAMERLVLGGNGRHVASFATPGGTGAIYMALQLVRRMSPAARVWISAPAYPNHPVMAREAGFEVAFYSYQATGAGVDVARMMADLEGAVQGDMLIVQGPCHNPTGCDLDGPSLMALMDLATRRGLIVLMDVAYHGLGNPLEEDLAAVRAALAAVPNALVSYSCSKSFGLYRERTGCLLALCANAAEVALASAHMMAVARACYSMPPAHGPAIVAAILADPALTALWEGEVGVMRARLGELRLALAEALCTLSGDERFSAIAAQKGMFSMLPLPDGAAARLAAEHGLYMPASGRVNIAGLTLPQVDRVASLLWSVCQMQSAPKGMSHAS